MTDTVGTAVSVQNANGPLPFPNANNYIIQIGTELMLVTAGANTNNWTVTRGYNGSTAATHSVPAPVLQVNVLSTAITTTGQTTVNLLSAVGAPSTPYVLQIGSEFVNVTAGTSTITMKRGANGTTPSTYAANTIITYVWPDPGLLSVVNQAHASGVKVIFVPLLAVWSTISTLPQLASTADIVGYPVESLQANASFPDPASTDVPAMRAAGAKKILVEMNVFVKNAPTVAYTIPFVANQIQQVITACNPDIIGIQAQNTQLGTEQGVVGLYRPS
jgi:hypothetical protein